MRTIKFRGRVPDTDKLDGGRIVYGSLVDYGDNWSHRYWINPIDGDRNFPVDIDSVAQLVGYDKAGNEVYEGDTVVDEYGQKFIARLKVIGVQKTDADEFELAENLETGEIVNCRTGEIVKAGGVSNGGA